MTEAAIILWYKALYHKACQLVIDEDVRDGALAADQEVDHYAESDVDVERGFHNVL